MKNVLLVSLFLIPTALEAQLASSDDIVFKAKLLTVFRLGIASPETILRDLNNQELTFLNSDTSKVILMKIKFGQHNFHGDNNSSTVLGQCFFYVAYNSRMLKFYRLGGFDSSDAADFFADLTSHEFIMLTSDETITRSIDLICLSEYAKNSKTRKRAKRQCVTNCSSSLSTYLNVK
jgi:hypothetical protein